MHVYTSHLFDLDGVTSTKMVCTGTAGLCNMGN